MSDQAVPPDSLWKARAVFDRAWRPMMNSLIMQGMPSKSTQTT